MMTRQERAKQFAPFDAMKGLQEALRDREERHSRVQKREISEDAERQISDVLSRLTRGMKVDITFYSAFHEVRTKSYVCDVNIAAGYIALEEHTVCLSDIYSLDIIEYPPRR
ncbi:MAG: hypothetical protein IJS71_05960 [Clostridia bacterium]|nr:hypothetical protein [Clostridia bacterium]